jgi:7-cyano-7-deazaguanine synthase
MTDAALVLFSGGQDSATCLAWALDRYACVETIGFEYGQRHQVEMAQRLRVREAFAREFPNWAGKIGADHIVDLSGYGAINDTALTRERAIAFEKNGLPNTFVPGRNLMFFTAAAALGYRLGIFDLIGGMCETDYSGYPDCRRETIDALEQTLRLGMEAKFSLATPLMRLTKAQTWALARDLGGEALVNLIRTETHTCYLGERGPLHEWGYGCGACPACDLRAKGWAEFASGQPAS